MNQLRRLLALAAALSFAAAGAGAFPPGQFGGPPGFGSDMPMDDPVTIKAIAPTDAVRPGERVPVAVVFTMARDWHINAPEIPLNGGYYDSAHVTRVDVTAPDGVVVGAPQWPEAHDLVMGTGSTAQKLLCYENRVTVFFPLTLPADSSADAIELSFAVDYQTCDYTKCLPPDFETLTLTLRVDPGAPAGAWKDDAAFATYDEQRAAAPPSTDVAHVAPEAGPAIQSVPPKFSVFGLFEFEVDPRGFSGVSLIMLVAAFGGLLLNLTPCVLPVLPIKMMSLANSAGSPGRALMLGLVMFAGIIVFWMALALAIIFLASFNSINSLFQRPWFGIGVGVFIMTMGIGMLGAFAIQLPQFVYRFNPGHDSVVSSFGFGVMTAILSTPCTAPFMGTAAAWATQQAGDTSGKLIVLGIFAAIGFGMGLPYVLLAAFPKLTEKLPRTGPASELLKQVIGGVLIAVAFFFGGAGLRGLLAEQPWLGKVLHWWLATAAIALTSLWMIYRTWQLSSSTARRGAVGLAGLFMTCAIGWWTLTLTRIERAPKWNSFDRIAFASAVEAQQVVLVEFTADW